MKRSQQLNHKALSVLFLLGMIAVITHCTSVSEETKASELDTSEDLGIMILKFEKKQDQCEPECARISVSYDEIQGNNRFNTVVRERVIGELQDFVKNGESYKDMTSISEAFIADYRGYKTEFPESQTPWYIEVEGKINFSTKELISYSLELESYSGGAHTSTEQIFFSVNPKGREIDIKSMITNQAKLMEIAENAFREAKGLGKDQDLSEAGFNFDNNEFQLPENIGFKKEGVILYYNDYEIGAYADGPTEILIPYSEVEDAMKIDS
jgi:hypothetical protein